MKDNPFGQLEKYSWHLKKKYSYCQLKNTHVICKSISCQSCKRNSTHFSCKHGLVCTYKEAANRIRENECDPALITLVCCHAKFPCLCRLWPTAPGLHAERACTTFIPRYYWKFIAIHVIIVLIAITLEIWKEKIGTIENWKILLLLGLKSHFHLKILL